MSLRQEVEPLTVFCQRSPGAQIKHSHCPPDAALLPLITHTTHSPIHLQRSPPNIYQQPPRPAQEKDAPDFIWRLCPHSTFTHGRSCWKRGRLDLRADTNLSFLLSSRFMCSVCLLVSRLIAARGFTGGYRLSGPACFAALMCFSWLPVRTSRAPPTAWPQQTKQGKRRGGVWLIWSSSS